MAFRWLKSLTPRSLFARTALILLVPILTIQIVVSYVFIQRLYERVTAQMTEAIVPSLSFVFETIDDVSEGTRPGVSVRTTARQLGIQMREVDGTQVTNRRLFYDLSGRVVTRILTEEFAQISAIDLETDSRRVRLLVETADGPYLLSFPRNRVSASNPHQLLVLMVFVAFVVTGVSFLFLKNQVRPIRSLAETASAFGRGHRVAYRPSGATEVRQAGAAFLEMRARIERHIEQRTLLLSGVSHDLRTPLTRMKLSLSMMPDSDDRGALEREVGEMQEMLDTFLDFASEGAGESPEPVVPNDVVAKLVERAKGDGVQVSLGALEAAEAVDLRPQGVERALQNVVNNARRYGSHVRIGVSTLEKSVRFTVEDDGPGIPVEQRDAAMRPFNRLDPARNQDRGGGVGLGLSIVQDIARQHGGSLRLGKSEDLGGLQVDLVLPR